MYLLENIFLLDWGCCMTGERGLKHLMQRCRICIINLGCLGKPKKPTHLTKTVPTPQERSAQCNAMASVVEHYDRTALQKRRYTLQCTVESGQCIRWTVDSVYSGKWTVYSVYCLQCPLYS